MEALLADIKEGRAAEDDLALLERNAMFIGGTTNTFCLHAPGAMEPLASALRYFRDDFEAHIRTGVCSYRTPGRAVPS